MPEVVALDFYEPDGTTLIGTLDDSQLIECEARPALQELGALRFVVSRHLAAASSALLAKGNFVKYRVPAIDEDPIYLFVLKDDISQLISREEQGGEHLEVTGPGGLWILQHARLDEEHYAPGEPHRGSWDIEGQWTWHGEPYGAILRRCIEEGQEQPGNPLGAITADFDRDLDSNGIAWTVIPEDFQVPIGTDVLAMAERLAAAGDLFLVLTPDMVLHAYQTFGRDLTGAFGAATVRFEKAVNTQTELTRKTDFDRVTHLITKDLDNVFRTYFTPDAYDQAVYGYLDIPWTNDEPQVEKTALNTLAASNLAAEPYTLEISPGLDPANGFYLPGPGGTSGHFWLADEVTLHTGTGEHDLNAVGCRVTALAIVLDQASDGSTSDRSARSLHIVPELYTGMPEPRFSGVGNGAGSTAVAGTLIRLCEPTVIPALVCSNTDIAGTLTGKWANGDVETDAANWHREPGVATRSNAVAHAGSWSIDLNSHSWYIFEGQTFVAGTAYAFKFWHRASGVTPAGGPINIRVAHGLTSDSDHWGAGDYEDSVTASYTVVAGQVNVWVERCIVWIPTETHTENVRMDMHLAGGYIDDCRVYEGAASATNDSSLVGTSNRAARCDHEHEGLVDPATTVEDETTWGISPDVGTDLEYARQDHTHGTPTEPDGSGSAPSFSGARLRHSTTQVVSGAGAAVACTFDTEDFDTSAYHAGGSPTRLTVPNDGIYSIGANVGLAANATGYRQIRLRIDGTTDIAGFIVPDVSAAASWRGFVQTIYELTAGQYVEVMLLQTSGGNLNTVAADGLPSFWIYQVG